MEHLKAQDGTDHSRLCFGTMQFGGSAQENSSRQMFEDCRDNRINFFDCAHVYNDGEAERLLGQFVAAERDAVIVATKCAYTGGSSRANILKQFDESRTRLNFDTVDILYLHRWDPQVALHETLETLCMLQEAAKIRYIGVSNFAAWQVMKAQAVALELGTKIDVIQPMYSLIKRQAEVELLPMALSENIKVAAYSPLGSGLLTGKYLQGGTGRLSSDKRYAARYGQPWMYKTAAAFSARARDMGIEPATLAVAWAAYNPAVTAPIISARNSDQLAPSLAAQTFNLTAEDYHYFETLSPRPAPATDRLEERC